jgi:hypothetical protein
MKRIVALLLALCSLLLAPSSQADTITATFTFTNRTVEGNTITVKGNVRRFTNDTSSSTSTLIVTNDANTSATNYYNHVGANAYSGVTRYFSSSNKVSLIGDATLTASLSGTFATLTLSTQSSNPRFTYEGPFTALQSTNQTNQFSDIVAALAGNRHTNSLPYDAKFYEALRTALTNGYVRIGYNDFDVAGDFVIHGLNQDTGLDEFWHTDAWGGGPDYLPSSLSGIPIGGLNGTNNPGLISRIGAPEYLANKHLLSPELQGTVSGAFMFNSNVTFALSPVFLSGLSLTNLSLYDPTNISLTPTDGGAYALFDITFPRGSGASGTNDVITFSLNSGEKLWNFGRWDLINIRSAYNSNTIARIDDIRIFLSSNAGPITASSVAATTLSASSALTAANANLSGTNTVNGELYLTPRAFSVTSGNMSDLNVGTNAFLKITTSGNATNSSFVKQGQSGDYKRVHVYQGGTYFVLLQKSSLGSPSEANKIDLGIGGTSGQLVFTNNPAVFDMTHDGSYWVIGYRSN